MKKLLAIPVLLALWLPQATRAAAEEVVTIDTRPGVTISFVVTEPGTPPRPAVILFAGGTGRVALWRRDPPNLGNNFLVRTRQIFARHGFLTVTVDVASDQREDGLVGVRASGDHRTDIAAVLGWVRNRTKAPVVLIGTSRGTVSAAHLGVSLRVEGVVLTAIVTVSSNMRPATAMDAKLEDIRVPVYLVNHRNDECYVTPAENLPDIKKRLSKSPRVDIRLFSGGYTRSSNVCQARTHHGFLGIEKEVIADIAGWIGSAVIKP